MVSYHSFPITSKAFRSKRMSIQKPIFLMSLVSGNGRDLSSRNLDVPMESSSIRRRHLSVENGSMILRTIVVMAMTLMPEYQTDWSIITTSICIISSLPNIQYCQRQLRRSAVMSNPEKKARMSGNRAKVLIQALPVYR